MSRTQKGVTWVKAGTYCSSANGASVRSNNFTLDDALIQDLFAGSTSTIQRNDARTGRD